MQYLPVVIIGSDPIGVNIFETRDERYGTGICGAGKSSAGNLFASSSIWKMKNPPSSRRRSKYVVGKEIRYGPTESSEIIKGEIQTFATCEL